MSLLTVFPNEFASKTLSLRSIPHDDFDTKAVRICYELKLKFVMVANHERHLEFQLFIYRNRTTNNAITACFLNAMHPFVEFNVCNKEHTASGLSERERNKKLAENYFQYDYYPYGVMEFRVENDENYLRENHDKSNCTGWLSRGFRKSLPHFPDKIPNDLNGCRIDALAIVWPPFVTAETATFYGLEHKLMLDVSRQMNFELAVEYRDLHMSLLSNRNTRETDILSQIFQNSSATMAFGNIYPLVDMHQVVDPSIGYLYDQINWIVPKAEYLPAWLNLLNCFR